ncbi:GTP-binding protein Rho1 [Serendipita sp. 405]|nr:GTP-binding protein Rho1 [Serendipita sp. 397]KAG8778328.1 GTP-binding protein Rho1 [Serendipita sp. 398]KAG8843170.1 GTP-binding protein Rho1 [Serendipita sp. 405]
MFRSRKDKKEKPRPRRLVTTGSWYSGKTCLLTRYCHQTFPVEYDPTTIDIVERDFPLFSKLVTLRMGETHVGGCNCGDMMRPYMYQGASVVIICFGIDNPESLSSVQEDWAPEVRACTGDENTPIILVGCKMDVRKDPVEREKMEKSGVMTPVSVQQGKEMAISIGAAMYLECSAKTGEGVDDVFYHAARLSSQAKAIS